MLEGIRGRVSGLLDSERVVGMTRNMHGDGVWIFSICRENSGSSVWLSEVFNTLSTIILLFASQISHSHAVASLSLLHKLLSLQLRARITLYCFCHNSLRELKLRCCLNIRLLVYFQSTSYPPPSTTFSTQLPTNLKQQRSQLRFLTKFTHQPDSPPKCLPSPYVLTPKIPFTPLTIPQELTHSQLINHCTESLVINDSSSARGHPCAVLDRGFEILHHLSLSFPHPSSATSTPTNQYKPLIDILHSFPTPDTQFLFHTLSTLLDASSFVRIELSRHRFTIGICVWAMCLGPRGLAQTWAEGKDGGAGDAGERKRVYLYE
jgi:hypothetical protein